jgi:uncharacterized protein YqcC (DUF446 family)
MVPSPRRRAHSVERLCDNRCVCTSQEFAHYRTLRSIVDRVEAELRRIALWEHDAVPTRRVASGQPFSYDTLQFHQWLQWEFIPRMRWILAGHGELPAESGIFPYAMDCLAKYGAAAEELLFLIESFDEVISRSSRRPCH